MSAIHTSNDYYTPIYGAEALADEYLNRATQMARSTTVSVPTYTGGVRLEDIFETVPIKSDQKLNQERKEALDAFDSLLDEEVNKE